jgi:hypothetical protein
VTAAASGAVRVTARLDAPLSRWLWLIKWLLVIPHAVVLAFLWVGFLVLTVVAFVAILVTGRYPRRIFAYTVGVLRWTWRVAFYTNGGFGTDRYPPFSLGECPDYPATLDIAYPTHLSRGLVLVKWWLLALPHYLVLGFLLGGGGYLAVRSGTDSGAGAGAGLIGLLALFAVIALLFTGRYPRGLFDLVLGLDRWVLRVAAYAALMTDQYPPFRLDLGGAEPAELDLGVGTATRPLSLEKDLPAPDAAGTDAGARHPWTVGRTVSVVLGSLLLLSGVGALAGGGALLAADTYGRDAAGYVSSPVFRVTGSGYALVAEPMRLGQAAGGDPSGLLGDIRVRVTGTAPSGVFVGLGRAAVVDAALGGVARDTISAPGDNGRPDPRALPGGAPATLPAQLASWAASVTGPGTQELRWTPVPGEWALVVMNADGSRPVVADMSVGATAPGLAPLRIALFVAGAIALAVGIALVGVALAAAGSGLARRTEAGS